MAYVRGRMARPAGVGSLVVAGLVALAGCSRADPGGQRSAATSGASRAAQPFDFGRPLEALRLTGDAFAARAGSFSWAGEVTWTVEKPGAPLVKAVERHRLRQLATGDFHVSATIDPGDGPGSERGKQIVFTSGMTYGRSRWAPFRERPTDRGRDARRFRDESLLFPAEIADLYGPALTAQPAGESTSAGRRARRYRLALSGSAPGPSAPAPAPPGAGYDADTKRRLAFLEGRVPTAASGELLLDAETGVPLSIVLKGSFSEKDDPQLRVDVDLTAHVEALGRAVPPVHAPEGALADDRKPKGVARALEAAGLRKRTGDERRTDGDGESSDE